MNILTEIENIRLIYEKEYKEKKDKLEEEINSYSKRINEINTYDYGKEYIETYQASLKSLERFFDDWNEIQHKTKGISFYLDEYIDTLKPEPIKKGCVEEYFYDLVKKGRSAIIAVNNSNSVEDDIEPQKDFCQCLCNLKYVVKNARRLIEETGLIEERRKNDLKEYPIKLAELKEELATLTWEKLKCANKIRAIKEELNKIYENIESKLIGKNICNYGTVDYNFLIGFQEEEINKEDKDFVKNIIKLPINTISSFPIYFNPRKGNGAILIRSSANYFESEDFLDFITNIYFSFSASLPAKGLYLAGVEKTADAVVRSIESQVVSSLGANYIFGGKVATESREIEDLIKALMKEYTNRSNVYRSLDDVTNVFEYNEVTPDNKHPLILCCINKYPFGMQNVNANTINDIRILIERGYEKGIIMILCQVNDQDQFNENIPQFDPKYIKVDCIDIDGKDVKFNKKNITTDITIKEFKANKFFKEIAESNKNTSASMPLDKLIEEYDRLNLPIKPFTQAISIPIGNLNGEWYSLDLKTCSTAMFGLFLGKSGSGKSAFIHTMMLSAGYYYAPDELQFYLVDFKDEESSPEFSNYMQKSEEKNMFIPHIRYLSVKSKLESAMDLLNKMEIMVNERSKQMRKLKKGIPDINVYNASEEVRSGKLPKIPQAIFIIDEYKTMLEGGADNQSTDYMVIEKISSKLQNLMTRLRAYGIGIIFLGHEIASGIKGTAFDQISTRITFDMGSADKLKGVYKFSDFDQADYYQARLVEKGNALVSVNGGVSTELLRMAYSGKTGEAQQLKLAEIIRNKYKDNPASKFIQVESGSEEETPITEFDKYDDAGAYLKNEIDEGKYYIPIGVSSASSLKMSLCYSLSKNASNYIAYADEYKLFNIERNAIFGFMNQRFDNAKIYFGSTRNEMKKFLLPFDNALDIINDNVEFVSNKQEIAKKLMSLLKLYEKRSIEAEEDDIEFDPILLVLHDISWLTEESGNPIWLQNNTLEHKVEDKKEVKKDDVDDISNMLGDLGLGGAESDLLAGLLAGTPTEINEEENEDDIYFTLNDVKNALITLHKKGNQCGIFLLIGAVKQSTVDTLLQEDKDEICKDYMIYGSFDIYTGKKNNTESNSCVYLLPMESKTRLFDYNDELYYEWWEKFN